MNVSGGDEKTFLRVVRFLERGPAQCAEAASPGKVLLQTGERGAMAVDSGLLAAMARDGVVSRDGARIALSVEGAARVRRLAAKADPFAEQHREIELVTLELPSGLTVAAVNLSESPLGQLARRKGKDGKPFLSTAEVTAGERLRSDYTRGQIMPRLGANWEASVASGRRDGGGSGGLADLTDAALAARLRVEKAIAAVGPELSGVLIDICCFLKGLEQVEAERGWPVRSAKVMLKSALGVLSRHYEPRQATNARRAFHWGAADYRPSIG